MFQVTFERSNGVAIDTKVFYTVKALNKGIEKALENDRYQQIASWKAEHNKTAIALVLFKETAEELDVSNMEPDELLERGFVQLFGNQQQVERALQSLARRPEGPDKIHQAVEIAPENNPKMLGDRLTAYREVPTGDIPKI